ncbi:MAG TPA: low temperature requirement protein A [Jatrophihabitans sp.]|nr:low temperature requirement protein A [Jatrophihabitans sp.]
MVEVRASALRRGDSANEVTNIELFFDLVYVFAVTQLSHLLGTERSLDGAVQTAVLLAMVWQVWVYTTWAVNYLDPNRTPARVMLIALMFGSMVLSAGLLFAFRDRGWLVAATYVAMQAGRALFAIWALRGEQLQMVFVRIVPWTTGSAAVMLLGAAEHGHVRELLWASSVAIDLIGAAIGFYFPGLGRSATTDWTISGSHFAERCQAFVLIALGESIIVIGGLLDIEDPSGHNMTAFGVAFAGAVALWWIYFDRAAADSAREIEASDDPGRLARNAFHWIHPLIIGGIITTAAADHQVLEHPDLRGDATTAWFVLGGTALFLGGHALFKAVVWRLPSWPRIGGVAVLAALGLLAPHVSALTLGICALAVVVSVGIADRLIHPVANRPAVGLAVRDQP